jgi:outer membrane protein, heavy metal efflux system
MKTMLLYMLSLLFVTTGFSQNTIDTILQEVNTNNSAIRSNAAYWSAQKAQYRTGLTPYDPQVEYDYLFGSPAGAGNQKDFSVTQRLDFPTAYSRKKRLSVEQASQADLQQQVFRQDILLEAKLITLELVYLNKRQAALRERARQTVQLQESYEKKLARGEVIILDVNKAKLQLLNIQNEQAFNENEIKKLHTRLSALNGGFPIIILDTVYFAIPVVPDFERLDSVIEANDPIIKVYDQEKLIMEKQVGVQKALNLPKIETGYHSQGILGQSYKGIHAGISIPLWENKNRLRTARLNVDYATENITRHRLEHRMENKELYDQLAVRQKAMKDYESLFASLNNAYLLDKALQLGQITVIQYFQEESYYFSALDKYLQLELEYHKAIAQLYKFQL